MVVGTTVLLALELLSFKGGSIHEFVGVASMEGAKPVVVSAFEPAKLKEFTVDLADISTASKIITQQTGLQMGTTYDFAFSTKFIDRKYVGIAPIQNRQPSSWSYVQDTSDLVRSGTVTIIAKPNEAVTLEGLKSRFSKPLVVHWMLEQVPMIVNAKNLPEKQFLQMAASAVGGKFVEKPDKFYVDFDPADFRIRARKTIQTFGDLRKVERPTAAMKAGIENALSAINLATNAQLTEAFLAPGSSTTILLNNTGKAMVARQLEEKANDPQPAQVDMLSSSVQIAKPVEVVPQEEGRGQRGPNGRGQRPSNFAMLRQIIDFNQPVKMILQSDFRVSFSGRTHAMGNRPSREINF